MNDNMAHLSKHTNVIARSAPRIEVRTNVIARRAKPDAATPRWARQVIGRLLRRCAPRNDVAFFNEAASARSSQ
jgi:hypothetical protein